jgi:hypothetical protein
MKKALEHKVFMYSINFMILLSSIILAMQNPLYDSEGTFAVVLYYIDLVTSSIFAIEMVAKWFSYGMLFCGKKSYLRDPWNIVDMVTVIFSILSLTPLPNNLSIVKVFRILRPLRIVNRIKSLRLQIMSLVHSIPNLVSIYIIFIVLLCISSIITMSFMQGTMAFCLNTNIASANVDLVTNKWDCLQYGGEWMIKDQNFDSFGRSLMTLFQIACLQSWSEILFNIINTGETDMAPVSKQNMPFAISFMIFILLFSFFLLNIISGIIISTFNRQRDKINGSYLLNDIQKEHISQHLLVYDSRP